MARPEPRLASRRHAAEIPAGRRRGRHDRLLPEAGHAAHRFRRVPRRDPAGQALVRSELDLLEATGLDCLMKDEGPSRQDIERFNRETAYCPDCGAEVWDQAEVCPKCFAYLGGTTSTRPPIRKTMDRK